MSSSQDSLNLLSDQARNSTHLYFLRQLPFYSVSSEDSSVQDFSSAYRLTPAPSVHLFIRPQEYRGLNSTDNQSPDTPDHSSSNSSDITLSPTLPSLIPADPFEFLLINSLENLDINQPNRQILERRLDSLNIILEDLSRNLIEEREQAILAITQLTDNAIRNIRNRLIPEIERLEILLRQRD